MVKKSRDGFTIVELLIVIVVIAILAVITVVAFNGIQARAQNTKTVTGISSFIKAMAVYKSTYETYPVNVSYPCIGDVPTECGVVAVSSGCFGTGYVAASASFNAEIKKVATVPNVSTQSMQCGSDGSKASGAFVYSVATAYNLYYFLKGNVSCGSPSGITFTKQFSIDTTLCNATIT